MIGELKLIVDGREFGRFAGYYHTDSKHEKFNEVLNEYIRVYKSNADFKYFQIECDHEMPMHTIAYICERVNEKYFINVDFANRAKDHRYWLCFYKDIPQSIETKGGE